MAVPAATPAGAAAAPPAAAASPIAAPVAAPGGSPDESARVVTGPPPATAAGAANGTAQRPYAGQGGPGAGSGGPGQSPPRIQIRPSGGAPAGRRSAPAPRAPARSSSSRGRRWLAAGLVVLSAAAVIAALLVVTSSGGGNTASSTSTGAASNAPTTSRHTRSTGAVIPSSVTVAVLNGTATSGLAHRVAVKLGGTGYRQGTVATATDQTRTSTIVAYMPGHRRQATAVATTLKLGPASVQPVDPTTQAVACPPPGACTSGVVVTVGSDLANTQ